MAIPKNIRKKAKAANKIVGVVVPDTGSELPVADALDPAAAYAETGAKSGAKMVAIRAAFLIGI